MNELVAQLIDPNNLFTAIFAVIIGAELIYLIQSTFVAAASPGGWSIRHALRALVPVRPGGWIYAGFIILTFLLDVYRFFVPGRLTLNAVLFLAVLVLSQCVFAVDRYQELHGEFLTSRHEVKE